MGSRFKTHKISNESEPGTPVAALINAADAEDFHRGPYQQA
jgi:hypothetical protein